MVFRVVQGNGSLGNGRRSEVATTDAAGLARTTFVLGTRSGVGANRVRATAPDFDGEVVFTAAATPAAPASVHVVTGDNQRAGPGQVLAEPLTVLVIDDGGNPVKGVPVSFEVLKGSGTIDGEATVTTDSNGRAAVRFVLGSELGLDLHQVLARFPGLETEPATFKAGALELGDPADTRVSGLVLDNKEDPVPGVTLRIAGTELEASTDAVGRFAIPGVPVGDVVLEVDATTTPLPGTWSGLEFDLHTLPGVDNTLPRPIYILPLDVGNGRQVGENEDVTITVPRVAGFTLTVPAGSATFPDGSKSGLVSVTPVAANRIPMTPGSGMQPRFIVTIQPAGTHFDPPAPVTFPNVDGLARGTVTEMFSFDHDLGQFVSIGTGTVSEDAMTIRSDPGFGIVKAGWHCAAGSSGSGAGGSLLVSTGRTVPLCVGDSLSGKIAPKTGAIVVTGNPSRDLVYSFTIANPGIASLDPVGGGLCLEQPSCRTDVLPVSLGRTTATVTITCTTTQESESQDVDVFVRGIEFVDTDESEVDLLRIFNPNPIVVMDQAQLAGTDATVSGTVRDFVAPVETVLVNGTEVPVATTSSGPDGLGPFEGTFTHQVPVGEADAHLVATAINALGNAGADTLLVLATRDSAGNLSRAVKPLASAPAHVPDPDDFSFRIEVFDDETEKDTLRVDLEGHLVDLERVDASKFRSPPLFVVPPPFNAGPLSDELKMTRILKRLGESVEVHYDGCRDRGVVTGALLVAPANAPKPLTTDRKQPFALVQDVSSGLGEPVGVVGLVGFPSEQGGQTVETITASIRSLGPGLAPVTGAPFQVPTGRAVPPTKHETVTLELVGENLYRTKPEESFLPVGGLLPAGPDPAFREIFVDPAGFLEFEAKGNTHLVPLAGPAFRDPRDLSKSRRLAGRFPPAPIVVLRALRAADRDLPNARVNRLEGLVVSFFGPESAPEVPALVDSLGRALTPVRDASHPLDSPENGVFVFRFTTADVDLSDRSFVRLTVSATSGGAFLASDSVDLRTVRDAAGDVTDITSAPGPVRPSWYTPVASGPDADQGVVLPEKLNEVHAPYQFVLVANALTADTRLLGADAGLLRASLLAEGGGPAEPRLFDFATPEDAPGELAQVPSGVVRTKRLVAVRDGLAGTTDVRMPTGLGRVAAALAPLSADAFEKAPPPAEMLVFEVELSTDADNDGDLDADDELSEHGRALREGLVTRTVTVNDDDDNGDSVADHTNATVDGTADEGDLARLVLRPVSPDVDVGAVVLRVSDKTVVRVFDENGTGVLGPAPGPDREMSDDLLPLLRGTEDREFRVEGVSEGQASLSLAYLDPGGTELFRDEVTVTVAPRPQRLAGIELGGFPHFDFVNTFNLGSRVQVTFDGFRRPDKVGKTADVYVVAHRDPADWRTTPGAAVPLVDVSGGTEALTVQAVSATESSMEKNVVDVWSVADVAGRYDVVFDFGTDADDPATPDGKFDPSVDFVDTLSSSSAGIFVVEDPGTIVRVEGGVPITETGFAEYIMEDRHEVNINDSFLSRVSLRGRIRYPASTTLVATQPVVLGVGNGTVSIPSPVSGASLEFFEAVYSRPAEVTNGSWFLLGEASKFIKQVPATVVGSSVRWILDEPSKFSGAVVTEGTIPFASGDRLYFTITREPLGGTRPVVFIIHGNHLVRLVTDPAFFDSSVSDPTRDGNLVILKTSDTPSRMDYRVQFDEDSGKWNAFSRDPDENAFFQGTADFETEFTTEDNHITFIIKNFNAEAGDYFDFDATTDTSTPDKSYRGYSYLADHLVKNGFITISISLDDWALSRIDGGIDARAEVLRETIERFRNGSGIPNILSGNLDFSDLSAIGHSRGGEVVPVAIKADDLEINRGVSIAPTRFTSVAEPMGRKDLLVLYGAYDSDVRFGTPFALYDRANGLKFLVFADKMNHNFFNRSWALDDGPERLGVTLGVAPRMEHEDLAKAYIMSFLLDSFHGQREFREYLLRDPIFLAPNSVTAPAGSLSIQALSPREDNRTVDDYDGVSGTNTLGRAVSGKNIIFDDIILKPTRFYRQDTQGGILEFDVAAATKPVYRSATDVRPDNDVGTVGLDITAFRYVTLRMAQEHNNLQNPRTTFYFSIALTDLQGQQSIIDTESFGFGIPPSYRREDVNGTPAGDNSLNKSHFKTVRIPLWAFTADGRQMNFGAITDVRLILDKPRSGRNRGALGVDDLTFEK